MKRFAFLLLAGIFGLMGQPAESKPSPEEIVWFGIDYTLVKFIGTQGQFSDMEAIQNRYFRSWNELIVTESDKYNLKKAFNVNKISYEFENTIVRSQQRSMENIVQSDSYSLGEPDVMSIVRLNTTPSEDKTGAIMVMETLNKMKEESSMWLAVFEISTGEILYMRRYNGAVGGFGFRNYWARSYYNVISKLELSPR